MKTHHKKYTVVRCGNRKDRCDNMWIVRGRPDRTKCPDCEKSQKFKNLVKFGSYQSGDEARERLRKEKEERNTESTESDGFFTPT